MGEGGNTAEDLWVIELSFNVEPGLPGDLGCCQLMRYGFASELHFICAQAVVRPKFAVKLFQGFL